MKILSWNVNGLRAAQKKGFASWLKKSSSDILCVQESRALPEQVEPDWPKAYEAHWNPAEKKGYSGVMTFAKTPPIKVTRGFGIAEHDKPVIFCGDLNVSHKEIDLTNFKANKKNAGFTFEERAGFDAFVAAGFIDTFREFETGGGHYTWWSNRLNARGRNIGWRIDYFMISKSLRPRLKKAFILPEVMGSDHCPVGIEIG